MRRHWGQWSVPRTADDVPIAHDPRPDGRVAIFYGKSYGYSDRLAPARGGPLSRTAPARTSRDKPRTHAAALELLREAAPEVAWPDVPSGWIFPGAYSRFCRKRAAHRTEVAGTARKLTTILQALRAVRRARWRERQRSRRRSRGWRTCAESGSSFDVRRRSPRAERAGAAWSGSCGAGAADGMVGGPSTARRCCSRRARRRAARSGSPQTPSSAWGRG